MQGRKMAGHHSLQQSITNTLPVFNRLEYQVSNEKGKEGAKRKFARSSAGE